MTCRLYIDEVGNDDINHPAERFLSITGIITKTAFHDNRIAPEIEALKTELFGHNPPGNVVILHRKEILKRKPPFDVLFDPETNARWEASLLGLIDRLPYIVITVMIDKHAHRDKYKVWRFNPYHYCMVALVERYVLWLNRHKLQGDVMIEPRFKKVDKALKRSFKYVFNNGTDNIPPYIVRRCLTSGEIKFERKMANVCGLQLADLIAHPSLCGLRAKYTNEAMPPSFGKRIYTCLEIKKLARHPKTRVIEGWGEKCLP